MANAVSRLFFDPAGERSARVPARYAFTGDSRWWTVALGVGIAALVVALAVGLGGGAGQRVLFAYLIGWSFCVSVALGALLFVMIQHLVKARWSVALRRIPEAIAANFPLLALAGLPILFGTHSLYHWSHAELYQPGPHYDAVLDGKAGYFFFPLAAGGFPLFFVLRYVVYFVLWSWLGHRLYSLSVASDTSPSVETTLALRKISAIGIPLTGVALAFASFDWLMSTDPHWFSTIFGVYFFAGGWLGAVSLIVFLALLLMKNGMLADVVSRDHIHDLGRFMFGFVVFWTYIAFSQYMLIWYANLAEETVWYAKRFTGGWNTVTMALVLFHFILPFFLLISRAAKRSYPVLATMAVWLLVMHFVDLWWVTTPSMLPAEGDHVTETHATVTTPKGHAIPLVLASATVAPQAPAAQDPAAPTALEQTQAPDPVEAGTPAPAATMAPDTDLASPAPAPAGAAGVSVDPAAEAVPGAGLGGVSAGQTIPQERGGVQPGQPAAEFRPTVLEPAPPIVEFMMWLGLFGLFVGVTVLRLSRHALTPHNDPYFPDSVRFSH